MEIKEGTIVWLKSGGPAMTIKEAMSERRLKWTCQWFEGVNIYQRDFWAHQLTTDNPNPKYENDILPIGFKRQG